MALMLMLGGCHNSLITAQMMVFQNTQRNYPIRGMPDSVRGVCYRSQPKGWVDSTVFMEWIKEHLKFGRIYDGKKRVIIMDNAGGHKITEEVQQALKEKNTEIRFLPKKATDICQPEDRFIIQNVRKALRELWDAKRASMVSEQSWKEFKNGSDKLPNPGKSIFIELEAKDAQKVNNERDKDHFLYTRKAMIRCGMARNINGLWEEGKIFDNLKEIFKKHRVNLDGETAADSMGIDGEVTESE